MLPRKQPHTEHTLYATQCRRHVQHTVVFRVKCPVPSSNHVVCYNVFARYTSRRNRSRPERENQRGRSSSPPARVDPRWRQRILSHQHSWLSTSQGKALCLCLAHSAIDCRPRACGKVNPSVSKPWRHLTTELGGAQRLTARSGRFTPSPRTSRLDVPQNRSGRFGEEMIPLSLPGTAGFSARSKMCIVMLNTEEGSSMACETLVSQTTRPQQHFIILIH